MRLLGSSAALLSPQQKTRIARSTEMRAMPQLFTFLTAAPTTRGSIFSCCRIRKQICRTSSTKKPAKGIRTSAANQRHPSQAISSREVLWISPYHENRHNMKLGARGIRYRVHRARGTPGSIVAILQFSTGKLFSFLRNGQISRRPRRRAIVTACVRSLAPSLSTKFLMWKLTVVSAMDS